MDPENSTVSRGVFVPTLTSNKVDSSALKTLVVQEILRELTSALTLLHAVALHLTPHNAAHCARSWSIASKRLVPDHHQDTGGRHYG
jgi:hypothetical protein